MLLKVREVAMRHGILKEFLAACLFVTRDILVVHEVRCYAHKDNCLIGI